MSLRDFEEFHAVQSPLTRPEETAGLLGRRGATLSQLIRAYMIIGYKGSISPQIDEDTGYPRVLQEVLLVSKALCFVEKRRRRCRSAS